MRHWLSAENPALFTRADGCDGSRPYPRFVSRPLTPSEAASALRRGIGIEQFISLADGVVRYLTSSRDGDGFTLREHVVHDDGTDDFADISEFRPINEDEELGEGIRVGVFDTAEEAVQAATAAGGAQDRWVNQAMAASDYLAAKRR
jgi:hypothetical protein